ncbi:pectinesterase QRT1 isoform X2 [Phalaenopsis equestris]|uniref:pectinesterase QRT1 isoform X2 n=1 Tax=Phalaenopsis equestris TaxID=78828 RepID=UPI0009E3B427|nr:pectinesterase QRT1 isoform X2 [Phalaenopsis equestris]
MALRVFRLLLLICSVFSGTATVFFHGLQMPQSLISWTDLRIDEHYEGSNFKAEEGKKDVLLVSKDGSGDSKTVQGAVNMVPDGNKERIKIYIAPGVYSAETVISWNLRASDRDSDGRAVGTSASATVAIEADYFCANGITFENTAPAAQAGASGMQAVALRLAGDKAVLYRCRVLSSQDTLFDQTGRHYFHECYIQGSIDFIFGNARSLYKYCTLHAVAASYGAITASQRISAAENSGFSLSYCKLYGTGMIYLGRAWGKYARVVYSYCQLDGIILPQGWSDWGDSSRQRTAWFGQFNCSGRGADTSNRVPWAKSLTYEEAKPFLDDYFIDGDQWLRL